MPGFVSQDVAQATLLQAGTLLCNKGVIGHSVVAGQPRDTVLEGVYIVQNGTAVTLTIVGFDDNTGTAASLVLTGSTTVDTNITFPAPLFNDFAAFTFTASVAAKVWVFTRAYTGP
jgi:hypothetical protein